MYKNKLNNNEGAVKTPWLEGGNTPMKKSSYGVVTIATFFLIESFAAVVIEQRCGYNRV